MDMALYARVLWRFKFVVILGFVLAAALATLSMVRVTNDGVTYRDSQLWASTTRLGVTQNGFPWGRLLATEGSDKSGTVQPVSTGLPLANPARLNELAVLYSELASSDPVRRQMFRGGLRGKVITTPVAGDNGTMLPLIDLTAIAATPERAIVLAERAAAALGAYIRDQQLANEVPSADRVVIQQLEQPGNPQIYQGRSKTLPIVVFLAVMLATVGLAFLLENTRPRPPASFVEPPLTSTAQREIQSTARRSA
jgi:hypothetical protein